jgi:hypothetical protein
VIPLLGFLEGDSLGLVVLAEETDTMRELAIKLQQSARTRVAPAVRVKVMFKGRELDPAVTVVQAGIEALDRFDVVRT